VSHLSLTHRGGTILRREHLYSSHITEWRKAAEAGAVSALGPQGGQGTVTADREIAQLRARAENAEAELARTKAALDIVGKAHALLETLSESTGLAKRPPR
jgi:transposase